MIDWQRVDDLRDQIGVDDFGEVIALFMEETDEVTARLTQRPDPVHLRADLHFLKGSALNLGLSALALVCAEGERAAAAGQADSIDLDRLVQVYQASKLAFLVGLGQRNAA